MDDYASMMGKNILQFIDARKMCQPLFANSVRNYRYFWKYQHKIMFLP